MRELAQAAQRGGDFVEYTFVKPGGGEQPKLSYAERIPGTEYWIGTGVYVDNVETATAALTDRLGSAVRVQVWQAMAGILLVLASVIVPLALYTTRSIVRPIRVARDAAVRVSQGDLDVQLDDASLRERQPDPRDEVAVLLASFRDMIAYLKQIAVAADGVAQGDLSVRVLARSDRDVLAHSMARATRRPMHPAGASAD